MDRFVDRLILSLNLILLLTVCCTAGAPAAPTNLRITAITCTSVRVSWDRVSDATQFRVNWMLINNRFRRVSGSRTNSAAITSITLDGLFESSQYTVQVTSLRNGIEGDSSPLVTFTASCPADDDTNVAPAPDNVRISEVTNSSAIISWDTVDGVDDYRVHWRLVDDGVTMTTDVTGGINSTPLRSLESDTQYAVSVSSLNMQGVVENTSPEVLFVTNSSPADLADSINQTNPSNPAMDFTNSTVPSMDFMNSTESTNQSNSRDPSIDVTNTTGSMNQTDSTNPAMPDVTNTTGPMDQSNSTDSSVNVINSIDPTDPMIRIVRYNETLPVAPTDLVVQIISYQMLMISWSYPPSLLAQTTFGVTYNLVSIYNTTAGIRSFAEYDTFYTTQTSFHFALISSVTNYIFTVTPYSATHAGESARVLVDDFSAVDLVAQDPVVFFNLRLHDATDRQSLSSSDTNNINSDLTRLIHSSISDICQCTATILYTKRQYGIM